MWRVNYFDISADVPQRAMDFYSSVFGWKFEKWNGPFDYWLASTGDRDEPGIDGGIARRDEPSASIMNFIEVPSVEDVSEAVHQHGGKLIQEKKSIPGVGYMAIIQDTEGNMFGIMKEDVNAK